MKHQLNRVVFLGVALLTLASVASAKDADHWQFSITPYLWLPTIDGELTDGSGTTVRPDDILKDLQYGVLLGAEVRKDKILAATDVVFLKMSDSDTVNIEGVGDTKADLDLDSWIVNLFGGYNLTDSDRLLADLVVGARYLYMGMDLNLEGIGSGSDSANVWNGVVGLRGTIGLGKNFSIPYHFDVGAGDSDLTWQALAGLGYQIGFANIMLVYQHLHFDQGGDMVDNLTMTGPALGVEVQF